MKTQLSTRIASEETEQKRRINAEEEKAVLIVQLEAARGANSVSAGISDNSDLDTYRVRNPYPPYPVNRSRGLPGVVFVMIAGKIPLLFFADMFSVRFALM